MGAQVPRDAPDGEGAQRLIRSLPPVSAPSMPSLSVSLVTYQPDLELLATTLQSLAAAVEQAREAGWIERCELLLVDNGPGERWREAVERIARHWPQALGEWRLLSGHGNVGYGRGHNLAMAAGDSDYHLVLNPDVRLAPDALTEGLAFLERRADVALLAPAVVEADGAVGHLCKGPPTVWDLFLRGFAPAPLRRLFAARMARYELSGLPMDRPCFDPAAASGCFMLMRGPALRAVGGFDDAYFMYFEDFDLTRRIAARGRVALLPSMRIHHYGGGASRKGLAHIRMFVVSAGRYFRRHGWRWW